MEIKLPTKKQLNVFVAGLVIICVLFSNKALKTGNPPLSLFLICAAIILLILYLMKRNFVVQFYLIWMRGVSCIGAIVTTLMMLILFYLVFSPVGLLLRLLKKDILHLKRDPQKETYWIDRPEEKFDRARYERQF